MDPSDAYEPSIPRLQLNLCIWLPQRPECVSLPWEIPAHVDLASDHLPLHLMHHVADALVRVDSAAAGLVIVRVWYYKHREISADTECCIYDASGGSTVSGLEDFLSCMEDGSRSGGAVADLHLEMGCDPGQHTTPAPMATESLPHGLVEHCRTFTEYPVCQLFELFSLHASDRASIVAKIGQKRTVTGSDMAQLLVAIAQQALQATLRRQRLYKAHRYVTAVLRRLQQKCAGVGTKHAKVHAKGQPMVHRIRSLLWRPAAMSNVPANALPRALSQSMASQDEAIDITARDLMTTGGSETPAEAAVRGGRLEVLFRSLENEIAELRVPPDSTTGGETSLCVPEGMRWLEIKGLMPAVRHAWAFAVAKRLHGLALKLRQQLRKNSRNDSEHLSLRADFDQAELPGCWCPFKARPAARSRARAEARLFLQLIVEQQRENMDELRAAYQHLSANESPESYQDASVHASGSKSQTGLSIPGVGLLLEHAELALDSLALHPAVRDRVKTLLHAQLSSEVSYNAEMEGGEIAVKELLEVDLVVQNLENLQQNVRTLQGSSATLRRMLCDGLAKPCDLVAALHVRVFDAINKESLREKITNRLGGTTLGVLVTQRLELLQHTYLQDGELCARANSRGRNGKPRSVMEDLDQLIRLLPERSSRLEDERSMKKIKAARLPPSDPLVQELNAKFAKIPVPAVVPGAAHPPAELNKHQLATWLGALPAIAELAYGSQRSVKLCDVRYVVMEMVELGAKQSRRSWKNSAPSVTYMAMIMTVTKLAWVAQRRMTGRRDAGARDELLGQLPADTASTLGELLQRLVSASRASGITGGRVPSPETTETGATADAVVDADPVREAGLVSEQTRRAVGEEIVKLDNEALMLQKHTEVSSADVKQMRRGLRALLELLRRAAEKVDGIDAGPYLQKVRLRVSEALTQAADIHDASLLIEDGNLGDVLAEAVGDVPVEEVQLTKLIYALTYRTTVDSVIKKCSRGAAREWLQVLMLRKPMIHKAEDLPHTEDPLAAAWLETAVSALDKAYKWATAVARVLDESFDAENRLIHLMTRATTDGLRVYQDRLNAMHDAINGVAKGDNLSLSGHTDGHIEDEAICALKTVGGAHDVMGICSVCALDGRSTQRSDSTSECRGCAARKSVFLVRQRGAERLLLQHLVERSVAGVVRDTLQWKLSDATVADDDEPLDLASAWRLPGRSPPTSTGVASLRSRRYPLSLRFAEGEEFVGGHGLVGNFGRASRGLLDAGQRLSPDGSEYNVIRLHRLMALQSAEADEQAKVTLYCMLDEHVELTLRSTFYESLSEEADQGEPPEVIRGRSRVLHYLCTEGFRILGGVTTTSTKSKQLHGNGVSFAQPCELTSCGDTRMVLCAGDRLSCGSSIDRLRVGEQLSFDRWGRVIRILRVMQPLETHYEWTSNFHTGNFATVRRLLDDEASFYCVVYRPDGLGKSPGQPEPSARMFRRAKDVFEQIEFEMARTKGRIEMISPPFGPEGRQALKKSWMKTIANGPPPEATNSVLLGPPSRKQEFRVKLRKLSSNAWNGRTAEQAQDFFRIRAAGKLRMTTPPICFVIGSDRSSSTLCFVGRWLPIGVVAKDYEGGPVDGPVVCVRETIGWTHIKEENKKSGDGYRRKVKMFCREIFLSKKLHVEAPEAPGLSCGWEMIEARNGRASPSIFGMPHGAQQAELATAVSEFLSAPSSDNQVALLRVAGTLEGGRDRLDALKVATAAVMRSCARFRKFSGPQK